MTKKSKTSIRMALLSTFIMMAYQNCGQPGALAVVDEANPNTISNVLTDCAATHTCPPPPPPSDDFECKRIVPLALTDPLRIPLRDENGTCYAVKLMDAVGLGPSSLTSVTDAEVISRNHDSGNGDSHNTRHPYVLGARQLNFQMNERRLVKLSGSGTSIASIRVDNFVIAGIYPKLLGPADNTFYRAYGTADSTINNSSAVSFRGNSLELASFGAAGTSTIGALDITDYIHPDAAYVLDVRALDCGGSRELSDIYLVFE